MYVACSFGTVIFSQCMSYNFYYTTLCGVDKCILTLMWLAIRRLHWISRYEQVQMTHFNTLNVRFFLFCWLSVLHLSLW